MGRAAAKTDFLSVNRCFTVMILNAKTETRDSLREGSNLMPSRQGHGKSCSASPFFGGQVLFLYRKKKKPITLVTAAAQRCRHGLLCSFQRGWGKQRRGVCFCLYSVFQKGKEGRCRGRGACISINAGVRLRKGVNACPHKPE